MANVIGPCEVNVNGRYAITCKGGSWDYRKNTTQHFGPYGHFGESVGTGASIGGSLRVSIPVSGMEFDWESELTGGASMMTLRGLDSTWRIAFEGALFGGESGSTESEAGRTEVTINWTAGKKLNL